MIKLGTMFDNFTFIPGKSQINNELKVGPLNMSKYTATSKDDKIKAYMKIALENPHCAGFSTLGYFKSNIESLTVSKYFGKDDGTYIKKIYPEGAYFCGCVKNCGKYLKPALDNLQLLSAFFHHFEVIIAYDESKDNSLNILKEMSKVMNITILYNNNTSHKNVSNISNARNSILNHIREKRLTTDQNLVENQFKYMFMVDMDNVTASKLNINVFHKYMSPEKNNLWDCLTFNQKEYYDLWALSIDDYMCSCWHFECNPVGIPKTVTVSKITRYITNKLQNAANNNNELVECASAFNGFGMYKLDKFIDSSYNVNIRDGLKFITAEQIQKNEKALDCRFNIVSWSGLFDCEHRYFHLKASYLTTVPLKICISPECLYKEYIANELSLTSDKCQYVSSRGLMESCDITPLNGKLVRSAKQIQNQQIKLNHHIVYMYPSELHQLAKNINSKLHEPIVLVTGDSDATYPSDIFPLKSDFIHFIENEKIIHWYTQNCDTTHPKLSKMPIGMDYHTIAMNKVPWWGPPESPAHQEQLLKLMQKSAKPYWQREAKMYSNCHFSMTTRYAKVDRVNAVNQIPNDLVYYEPNKINRAETWRKQMNYSFVLSPLGNGYDCHRTWEALILGCIVIMKKNPVSDLFDGLPVLVVDEWTDLTQKLLDNTVKEYQNNKAFRYEKLELKYWVNKIKLSSNV